MCLLDFLLIFCLILTILSTLIFFYPHMFESAPPIMPTPESVDDNKKIEDALDDLNYEEIASGDYGPGIKYFIKFGRSSKPLETQGDVVTLEIPVNLDMQNEDQYENQDCMNLKVELDKKTGTVRIVKKLEGYQVKPGEKETEYKGELDQWYEDAKSMIEDKFKK